MLIRAHTTNLILAVDSDSEVRQTIGRALEREGHHVIEAADAETALRLAREHRPDVIILATALSDMNGLELCTHLRNLPYVDHTPILFVSAWPGAQGAAEALNCGGDDYLRRPFATRELSARVRALLRRSPGRQSNGVFTLHLLPDSFSVIVNGRHVELTPTEFSLLDYLCRHPDQYHAAQDLLQNVWHYPPGTGDTALVRNHIRNLRRKVEPDPDRPAIILAQHGRGYTIHACIV